MGLPSSAAMRDGLYAAAGMVPSGIAQPKMIISMGSKMPMTPAPAMNRPHQNGSMVSILYRIASAQNGRSDQDKADDQRGADEREEHESIQRAGGRRLPSHAEIDQRAGRRERGPGMVEHEEERD